MLTALCWTALALSAFPALLFLSNLRLYRPPAPLDPSRPRPSISLLIPARNEEPSITVAVSAAMASRDVDLEVLVLDDHSTDATADIVRALADPDPRLRLHEAPALPPGWCGKQHACHVLASLASKPLLVFLDADVRLAPDALARMAAFLDDGGLDLASGFPRQETVGLVEKMVIPLMHFILLGFLPLDRMRSRPEPGLAAGCGQLFITRKSSYDRMGGHAAIRTTLHDGLKLPRAYRKSGLKTDLFDATPLATCRMYRTPADLWSGLAKNATEALAAPALILPASILLLSGQVLPLFLLLFLPLPANLLPVAILALAFSYLPRLLAAYVFRQSLLGALLHPLGVLILLAIQWYALTRTLLGLPPTWKGRPYPARPA